MLSDVCTDSPSLCTALEFSDDAESLPEKLASSSLVADCVTVVVCSLVAGSVTVVACSLVTGSVTVVACSLVAGCVTVVDCTLSYEVSWQLSWSYAR